MNVLEQLSPLFLNGRDFLRTATNSLRRDFPIPVALHTYSIWTDNCYLSSPIAKSRFLEIFELTVDFPETVIFATNAPMMKPLDPTEIDLRRASDRLPNHD